MRRPHSGHRGGIGNLWRKKCISKNSLTIIEDFDKAHVVAKIVQKSKTDLVTAAFSSTSLNIIIDPTSFLKASSLSTDTKTGKSLFPILTSR